MSWPRPYTSVAWMSYRWRMFLSLSQKVAHDGRRKDSLSAYPGVHEVPLGLGAWAPVFSQDS